MFTFVIVAFVILLALTAFVPRVRGWVQWVFKKAALVAYLLVLYTAHVLAQIIIWLYIAVFGGIYYVGKLLLTFGNWAIAKLSKGTDNLSDSIKTQADEAIERFR